MPVPIRFSLAIVSIVFCSLASVVAQSVGIQEYSGLQRRSMGPGLSRGTMSFQTPAGVTDVLFSEVDLSKSQIAAEMVFPAGDPHRAVALESLAASVDATAVLGLELQPPPAGTLGLNGLRFNSGRIYSWPAMGGTHLVLMPEGALRFYEPANLGGTVDFDDGTSMTLASVNGRFPSGASEAAIYTGALRTGELPVASWTENPVVVVLQPIQKSADPHALLLENEGLERRFTPVDIRDRNALRTATDQAVLILASPLDPKLAEKIRRRMPLRITVEMSPRELLAEAIAPIPPPLMRDGVLQPDAADNTLIRNALVFDEAGQRILMLSPSVERARGFGVPFGKLKSYLAQENYTNLVVLDRTRDLLLPQLSEMRDQRDAANAPVRIALAIQKRAPTLELAGVDSTLHRIRSVVVQGTRREFPANLTRALRDERIVREPGLDSFWAVPVDEFDSEKQTQSENPNRLLFLFPRAMPIAALELVHAESAGFSPEFDLKSFRLMGRRRRDLGWQELLVVNHESPVPRERIVIPGAPILIEMRLEIIEPNFIPQGDVARLSEVFFWSTEPEVK